MSDRQLGTFRTEPLRIDEFLDILRERYGLYIDRLPDGDGFGPAIVTDHAALRENRAAFIARLREIGFYSDLSDAYLTQTITPRYIINAERGQGHEHRTARDHRRATSRRRWSGSSTPRLIEPARPARSPATARA